MQDNNGQDGAEVRRKKITPISLQIHNNYLLVVLVH